MANYTYLPWVRQGLISAATAQAVKEGRIELTVSADIQGGSGGATQTVNILLYGPGDVTGMDPRQVIRTDPPHLASDWEPNYFPMIEFDRPDFPWLFAPEIPDASNQLKPWICLIVVEKRDGVELKVQEGQPLPVLTIAKNAHQELPNLAEAWAWVHAQVGAVSDEADLQNALESQPERTLSRLLCPRRLAGKTAYYACVVPTYLGGVQAGLGQPVVPDTALQPAWDLTTKPPDNILLPVYTYWEFATGAQGDFESLVWQLQPRPLTFQDAGTRKMEISQAGYALPASPAVDLQGALAPQATDGDDPLVGPFPTYQSRLQDLVNGTAAANAPVLPPPLYGRWHAAQRTIPDPLNTTPGRDRPWLRSMNLDPRYRVAAGLGAQIVRDQQEQLMASAWDQVGDIEQANRILRQAQAARAASASIHQERFGLLDATTFLLVSSPVQKRVSYTANQTGQTRTAYGHVKASVLPRAVTSAQFRRMLRPRGATARRFGIRDGAQRSTFIAQVNQGLIRAAPSRWPDPDGMLTMERLLDQSLCNVTPQFLAQNILEKWSPEMLVSAINKALAFFNARRADILALSDPARVQVVQANKDLVRARELLQAFLAPPGPAGADLKRLISQYQPAITLIAEARWLVGRLDRGNPGVIADIDQAMNALPTESELTSLLFGLAALLLLQSAEPCDSPPVKYRPPLDIEELVKSVQQKIDPQVSIPARVGAMIQAPGWNAETLDFILAAPSFPAPMYKALVEKSQEWLLPGLERVPRNTLALLESNTCFIEAFMVGLNHEMSRELLWRGYPTDQRGTYFRQFWDPSGRFSEPDPQASQDIPPLHEWKDAALGDSFGKAGSATAGSTQPTAQMVLLMRGDLLARYPRASIFAAKAAWSVDTMTTPPQKQAPRNPTADEKYPLFRGELSPDINFFGFDLDPVVARGTPAPSNDPNDDGSGWFIVIQQQPTEPRYGLDETPAPTLASWRDLAWVHVSLTEANGYIQLSGGLSTGFPADGNNLPKSWKWSSTTDSAQIACITLQAPARVAIHASDLLP